MKLGIFGGTFNPIHFGHLRAAEEVRELAGLDRVLFMPSGTPPLKSGDIASARHRLEMTLAAVRGAPGFEVLDIEITGRGKSYTVHTLKKLHALYPSDRLYLILGIDAFADIPNWYMPDLICASADFIVLSRPGFRFADLSASPYLSIKGRELKALDAGIKALHSGRLRSGRDVMLLNISPINISATDIRTLITQGRSVKYLLPAEVESFIISHKLYAFKKTKDRALKRGCR